MVGWLIRVTNCCCCSVLLSPRANPSLPSSLCPRQSLHRRGDGVDGRRVKMRGSIWRNESRDPLLAPFGLRLCSVSELPIFTTTSLCEGDGASDERDSHNHNDNSNRRTDEGERLRPSGLPTQIERSVKTLGPILHPSNPVCRPASERARRGQQPPILMRLPHKNGP